MAENAEKVFEKFLELSPKLRTVIIDEMAPNDRCRFTRCSKLSNQEAKASKNYIYGMYVLCRADAVAIILRFDKNDIHKRCFIYFQESGKPIKQSATSNQRILWSVDLDSSKNLDQYVNEEVASVFQSHGNSIRMLGLNDLSTRNLDLNVELLKNLEDLEVTGNTDALEIFSKLQKPLKQLCIEEVKNNTLYTNCEQIYQVEETLIWKEACFNNQQFLQISARWLGIDIGQLTEKDIFSFIRSWQNGTIGRNIEYCQWNWANSSFDKKKLARLLRLPEFYLNPENADDILEFEIKRFCEPGKSAKLCFSNQYLDFDTAV